MKVLVAGGAGFVGSHLSARLLAAGHTVYCVDNLITGHRQNIDALVRSHRFFFIRRSVIDPIWLPVDLIFNLASPASPPQYRAHPLETLRTNTEGTLRLLQLAENTGGRLIYASSSEVYGNPSEHPQPESYPGAVKTMGPRACYDEGKRCGETACYLYAQRGVRSTVVRIFNTYGPRMRPDDGRAVSNLIVQALRGEPLTVYGDGSQTRSFCYVDDLVDALVALAEVKHQSPGPINLGNPEETTVLNVARKILALTGSASRIVFEELPVDDPLRRCPDISLAEKTIGWHPSTGLEDGLRKTVHYFRQAVRERRLSALPAAVVQ